MIQYGMKSLFILLFLPSLLFGSNLKRSSLISRKRSLYQETQQTSEKDTIPNSDTNFMQVSSLIKQDEDSGPKVDHYAIAAKRRKEAEQELTAAEKTFENSFQELKELCRSGRYHKLPLDPEFVLNRNPSDYLALAIQAHDPEAIAFSQRFVELEFSSSYLQSTLIDLILSEDTAILEQLGATFQSIYTHIFVFFDPFAHLSGTSLIRIAIDQGKNRAAIAMFKSVPVSVIGDFWQTINSMKSFVMDAMVAREIRLKPREGESNLSPSVLKDIFFTCVALGNLKALEYLYESTHLDLTTRFEEEETGILFTAMYLAAHTGYADMVAYLGKMCPELYFIETSTGVLPIHAAASNGHADIIKLCDDHATKSFSMGIEVNGIKQTPFSVAIRNKKRNIADIILSFIDEPGEIEKEMSNLLIWAIVDDNPSLIEIYFEYGVGRKDGSVENSKYTLLEMAIIGTNDPEKLEPKGCRIKCLEFLIQLWKRLKLPFEIEQGNVRGNILGLLKANDIDAFVALVKDGGVDPNAPIIEYCSDAGGKVLSTNTTTFLNRIIAQGANELVPIAIRHGADPRLVNDDGYEAILVAELVGNDEALKYLISL